jgi:transposase
VEYGAIDLHKKERQIQILTEGGKVSDYRIATTRERLAHVFWGRPRMRILVEASTESEWVAQHLEELGHEVIVADPNYGPMYGQRSRRIKTDRRDVAALREACQHGTYRSVHRRSARQREVQCHLNVRQELTRARTRAISLARSITRGAGFRIRGGGTETFLTRLAALEVSAPMQATLSPLCRQIDVLNAELAIADAEFAALVGSDPIISRLTTVPGIGPITAAAFVAALDTVSRFERAGQVTSYLGLVPHEYSSGEKQRRGRVVRSSHPQGQSLLVQAAWRMWRATDPRTEPLRTWALGLARRRGKRIAAVALARRLARTLFAMWRDQPDYQPERLRPRRMTVVGEPCRYQKLDRHL